MDSIIHVRVPDVMVPDRSKYPQIFTGCRFHFNGIIPKSLLSLSFNKEWRMAVAHGAECTTDCDLRSSNMITHLIYRRGYERSDKVRAACLNPSVFVVPVEWMLDSMMEQQRMPEAGVRLCQVPLRSLPIDLTATSLEHHRHPFYVANHDKFPEPSAAEMAQAKAAARVIQETGSKLQKLAPPPAEPTLTVIEPWPVGAQKAQLPVLSGTTILMSDGCPAEARTCAQQHGALLAPAGEAGLSTPGLTHLVYAPEDRRSPHLARAVVMGSASLIIAPLLWLQDCVQAKEHLPNAGPYVIPPKLLNSLRKKEQPTT